MTILVQRVIYEATCDQCGSHEIINGPDEESRWISITMRAYGVSDEGGIFCSVECMYRWIQNTLNSGRENGNEKSVH